MCRWLAYSGAPIYLRELILRPRRSLIDQSLSARVSRTTTNGDGFGIGWYDGTDAPGLYKHVQPAWSDPNLADLCHHVRSPLFMAHVRAATRTATQHSNCHPFRWGRWLFVHNGQIPAFHELRRELAFGVPAEYFGHIQGTTDSEIMFYLALGFGMADDVQGGLERMVGYVEQVSAEHGGAEGLEMTVGVSDGSRIHAVRYATAGEPNTLYYSKRVAALWELVPAEHAEQLGVFSMDARAIVSEPLTDLSAVWEEVAPATLLTLQGGEIACRPFRPQAVAVRS